ncbi:MAG: AAA family ATPase [Ignavibacteria bacterium]|nr:AAA family ATPase [Ignavibacteria bacterium]
MITKIDVKNFKNFEDFELELKPLNVLIGANGTGKSNFIKLIQFYKEGAELKLLDYISSCGGGRSFYKDFDTQNHLSISFFFRIESFNFRTRKKEELIYNYNIIYDHQYFIKSEFFTKNDVKIIEDMIVNIKDGENFKQYKALKKEDLEKKIIQSSKSPYEYVPIDSWGELLLLQIEKIKNENLDLVNFLKNIEIHSSFDIKFGSEMRRVQLVKRELLLQKNGDNLINILNTIFSSNPQAKENIKKILEVSFENFKDIVFPPTSGQGQIDMEWQYKNNKSVSTYFLSDGQLKLLCLLALLYNPNHKGLICIEEPELYLHTSLHKILGEVLKEASQSKQIIVTTHSPDLLNALQPEDVCVLNTNKETGYTNIKRLDKKDELESWLEDYELGELWKMGEIGAKK